MSYGALGRRLAPVRRLCRSDSQRREAGQSAGSERTKFEFVINLKTAKSQDRQVARPHGAPDVARHCRRGDRV